MGQERCVAKRSCCHSSGRGFDIGDDGVDLLAVSHLNAPGGSHTDTRSRLPIQLRAGRFYLRAPGTSPPVVQRSGHRFRQLGQVVAVDVRRCQDDLRVGSELDQGGVAAAKVVKSPTPSVKIPSTHRIRTLVDVGRPGRRPSAWPSAGRMQAVEHPARQNRLLTIAGWPNP